MADIRSVTAADLFRQAAEPVTRIKKKELRFLFFLGFLTAKI